MNKAILTLFITLVINTCSTPQINRLKEIDEVVEVIDSNLNSYKKKETIYNNGEEGIKSIGHFHNGKIKKLNLYCSSETGMQTIDCYFNDFDLVTFRKILFSLTIVPNTTRNR